MVDASRVGALEGWIERIEDGGGSLDRGKLGPQVGGEVVVHCVGEDVRIGRDGVGSDDLDPLGILDEHCGGLGGGGFALVGSLRDDAVAHLRALRFNHGNRGLRAEEHAIKGQGIDDEELLDVFRVSLSEHESEQAAERMPDHRGDADDWRRCSGAALQ